MRLRDLPARFIKSLTIVERELRVAARGNGAHRWRTAIVAIGLGCMALLTASLSARNLPAAAQGLSLFQALVVVSTVYAYLAGVSVTADSVSKEKREGTLGLLFLTDLRARDIILGKLAANALHTVYGLLGLLPLLAIPVMMGGVSITTGVGAAVGVMNLSFVSLSVGMFVSALSWDERRATFAAIVSGLVVMLGPTMLAGLGSFYGGQSPLGWVTASLSPLFPLIRGLPAPGNGWTFLAFVPSHLLGWVLLINSGHRAQAAWHSRSGNTVRRTVDERVFTPRDPVARARHRRRALRIHPLVWLLERHPGKRFYADGLVLAVLIIWAWGYRAYGTDMFGGPTWFLVIPLASAIHLILASWVVSETSMRLLEDRRSGALELLLCTSLTDRDIIGGHRLVLRRLFLRPVLLLAAAEMFVAITGFGQEDDDAARNGRWMMLGFATAIVLDTQALSWIALRLAVALPNVSRVGMLALLVTPLGPIILTALVSTALALMPGGLSSLEFSTVFAFWISFVVIIDLIVGPGICRTAVLRSFRRQASRVHPSAAVAA